MTPNLRALRREHGRSPEPHNARVPGFRHQSSRRGLLSRQRPDHDKGAQRSVGYSYRVFNKGLNLLFWRPAEIEAVSVGGLPGSDPLVEGQLERTRFRFENESSPVRRGVVQIDARPFGDARQKLL